MALSANTVWEVRTSGSDSNGGGFVTGASGTDRSQQDAAHATLTAASVVHTTTTQINVAVGDYTVVAADVGNILQITGGTATAGFYQITAVDIPNNRWTVDRSAGAAGATVVGAMGGALASPGLAFSVVIAGNTIWQKAGTYSLTTNVTNVSGGCVSIGVRVFWEGYQAVRGDLGTAPLLQAGAIALATIVSLGATNSIVRNIGADGAGRPSLRAWFVSSNFLDRCYALNCSNNGFVTTIEAVLYRCYATGCTSLPAFDSQNSGRLIACVSFDNVAVGFDGGNNATTWQNCLSYGNTGAIGAGFQSGVSGLFINCTAYGNVGDGFTFNGLRGTAINCIAEANGGFGFSTNQVESKLYNCAAFNNTSGVKSGSLAIDEDFVTGTSTFFVDAPNDDFALNNTVGGGADARAVGYPGLFPLGLTEGFLDIGAAQHVDSGGGGGGGREGALDLGTTWG